MRGTSSQVLYKFCSVGVCLCLFRMKWACLFFLLGYLFVGEHVLSTTATKRFRDVMAHGKEYSHNKYHHRLDHWYSDHNNWNDKLYPTWEKGDSRWKNCWKGGKVVASLTNDSPALVGSNVTFTVILKFPRCQKEDNDSNIIYDRKCLNNSSILSDEYVYNWTQWIDNCSWLNCTYNNSNNVFPDGKPFPYHHGWRRKNFIYIFHTVGQYYQIKGGSSVMISINTTNITVGNQIMELAVYRRGYHSYAPVTTTNAIYVVTDQIPFYVNISQKNNRNVSDFIFIKDIPIMFDVRIHDPSHYLNHSTISYHWNFGDGSGSFVSNNSISTHTYTLLGNFSANLSIQAVIPVPCGPVTVSPLSTFPAFTTQLPPNATSTYSSLTKMPTGQPRVERCSITRYGTYKATLTIVEGILEVNIVQMTSVQMTATQAGNSLVDFVVTCQGSLPTDVCTLIADPTCTILQSESCNPVDVADICFLTIRRAFNESGTYCVNITLADAASLALTSTLISINGASFSRTTEGILVTCGFLVVLGGFLTFFLYKRYKEYKPIERKSGQGKSSEGLSVYFNNVKALLFPRGTERDPLLKSKAGIV